MRGMTFKAIQNILCRISDEAKQISECVTILSELRVNFQIGILSVWLTLDIGVSKM